ncbi:SanA/YdcF family protein [Prevotellamassilia timonensis]|uniref:SanA/YdcF family protein n=1 Tax=Prevotellamassilia timonensis TaxID=1852370 RepID=UPI00307AB585
MKAHSRGTSVSFGLGHIARYAPSPEGNICTPIMHFQCKNNFEHLLIVIGAVITTLLLLATCNNIICSNAEGRLYTDIGSIPPSEVGLLLGTTPQTRIGHKPNQFFKYRIDATESLYKAGKIKLILISGDGNSLDGINEVECMKDSLVARGIPKNTFILDEKGFRTLDAVVRATKIYNVHCYVVISQKFHCERAIYLAEHCGLDVHNLVGFNAADATSNMAIITYIREYFARVKVFVDIFTGKEPRSMEKTDTEPVSDVAKDTTREEKGNLN